MAELRDYVDWHRAYDDPDSGLSWRLATVRRYLHDALDRQPGPVRLLSLCAGDGRDVVGVLADRPDAERVSAVLVEVNSQIADSAREAAAASGLGGQVQVRVADAARPVHYADAVPADVVLLVGIFGNISDADLWATVDAASGLCAPGATLLWSRGRDRTDRNDAVRARFAARGFSELAYDERDLGSRPALGAVRYNGPPVPSVEGPLFTFLR